MTISPESRSDDLTGSRRRAEPMDVVREYALDAERVRSFVALFLVAGECHDSLANDAG